MKYHAMYLKECKEEQNWLHNEEERIEIHDGHPMTIWI